MVSARLRHGSGWSNAHILNMSSRGLLIRACQAPPRGTYIEVCSGQLRIAARVIWAKDDRFGVQTQDRLAVDVITKGIEPPAMATGTGTAERRSRPREPSAAELHERSRQRSRLIEFACVAAFGVGIALVAFDSIQSTLSRPLAIVSSQLSARPEGAR